MLKSLACIIVSALLLAASSVRADENPAIQLKGAAQSCTTGIKGDICRHYFEQDKVQISYAPPAALKGKDCPNVQAELVQISTRLEAPMPEAVTPATASACESSNFEVQLPYLGNETEFEIVFRQETENGKWKDLQAIALKVYPRKLMDSVKSWSEFKDNALIVNDKEGKLAGFLDRHNINYLTRDTAPQVSHKLYIVTGKDAEEVEGEAIYLRENVEALPVVKTRLTAEKMTVNVNLKLLDALAADDPLAQKMFVEIFNEIAK